MHDADLGWSVVVEDVKEMSVADLASACAVDDIKHIVEFTATCRKLCQSVTQHHVALNTAARRGGRGGHFLSPLSQKFWFKMT